MKIAIKPVNLFVSGRGLVTATHVEVTVSLYVLGSSARGHYVLQEQTAPAAGDKPATFRDLVSGAQALTPEQFAAWGTDDSYFLTCILKNLGLTPAA